LPKQQLKERIIQVAQQLQADIVAPAEATCKQSISRAKAEAAQIIEDGKAQVEGIQTLAESWQAAGGNAKDIFLFQKLDVLLNTLVDTVPAVKVQSVTVIDAQNGNQATRMAAFMEQFRQATGLDLTDVVNRLADRAVQKED
jgi:flotillin